MIIIWTSTHRKWDSLLKVFEKVLIDIGQYLGQILKRWRKEFLPSLDVRNKEWFHLGRNLKEGDVVIIVEPYVRRGESPLDRMMEAYPGDGGVARVIKVKAWKKEYFYPVHHLCTFEHAEDFAEEWELLKSWLWSLEQMPTCRSTILGVLLAAFGVGTLMWD